MSDRWMQIESGLYACLRGRVVREDGQWFAEPHGADKAGPFGNAKLAKADVDARGAMPQSVLPERVRSEKIKVDHPISWAFQKKRKNSEE